MSKKHVWDMQPFLGFFCILRSDNPFQNIFVNWTQTVSDQIPFNWTITYKTWVKVSGPNLYFHLCFYHVQPKKIEYKALHVYFWSSTDGHAAMSADIISYKLPRTPYHKGTIKWHWLEKKSTTSRLHTSYFYPGYFA